MDAFAGHLATNLASAGICPDKLASAGIDPNTLMIDMWELVNSGEVGQAEALLAAVIKVCTPASAVPAADAQNPAPPAPASAAPPAAASAAPAATTAPASAAPVPELVAPPAASAAPAATPASAAHAVPELVAPPAAASSAPAATTAPASAAHAVPEVVAPASAVPAPAVPTAGAALEPAPVTPPPMRMLASPRAGLPAMPTEPVAAAASAVHRDACHIDTPSCKAVVKGTRRWGTRRALANRRPAASAAAAATDSQPAADERMLMTDLRTAFMNAMRAASAELIEPVSELFKHVNPNAHLAPTDSQMFWAIEQSDVQLGKAEIAALAADIVSTWRACRRGMQRHHECDKIVGRMWPGRCVQDVALAIDDRAKYEAFMDTLVLVDTEFSILASAMATDPAVPERLMKRPAASAAPASPGSEESDFEGESAPPPSKKTAAKASAAKASAAQASVAKASAAQASAAKATANDLQLARSRLRSAMISDPNFMPGAASRVRFGAAQNILKAARAGYSHAALAASPDVDLRLKDFRMTASAVEHRSGCSKCRWNSSGCRKCRGE